MVAVVLLFAAPAAIVALVVALVRRPVVTVGVNEHAELVRVVHHTRGRRGLGLVLGLAAGVVLLVAGQDVDALGRLTAFAPAAVGSGVLLGTLVGELTARPRLGVRRSAVVETRTVRGLLPRAPTTVLAASVAVLGLLLAAGVAWGAPDDLGVGDRAFVQRCTVVLDGVESEIGSARSPWPGSYYAVPLAAGLGVVLLLAAAALGAVARRARPPVESRGLDSVVRRWSVRSVLTAGTFAVLGTLAPVAAVMAQVLSQPACPLSAVQSAVRWVALGVAPVALVGAAVALGLLLVSPTIRVDDLPRPVPGDPAPVGTPVR